MSERAGSGPSGPSLPPGPSGRVARASLIQLLSPTLGMEKSREIVGSAVKEMGFPDPNSFSLDQASSLLEALGKTEGIVGVVARFALGRVTTLLEEEDDDEPIVTGVFMRPDRRDVPAPSGTMAIPTITSIEIVELFAATLGANKAEASVRITAAKLGLGSGPWARPQVLTLLDHLAAEEGIVGVVARFSKARLLLKLAR